MPKFYIGSTSIKSIENGYLGSVSSEKYKDIWYSEIKENRHLFEIEFLYLSSTRDDAYEAEKQIQIDNNVVKDVNFINLSIARGNNFGASGEKHPFFSKTKDTSEIVKKFSISLSQSQRGQTKYTSPRVLKQSITLTGRTKETHEYIAIAAEKRRGRTKDNHEGINRGANLQRGRTKDNHQGLKTSSEKQTGRTKETHEYLLKRSEERKGRNKNNCDFVKRMSEKLRLLDDENEMLLFELKNNNNSNKEIIEYFKMHKNIELKYSTVSTIFNRIKKQKQENA